MSQARNFPRARRDTFIVQELESGEVIAYHRETHETHCLNPIAAKVWAAADGDTHVSRFVDMHDLGDALLRAGFADPVMDVEHFTLTYPSVRALMRELTAMGAHTATAGRSRGLTGRGRLAAVEAAYERLRTDGRLPSTWEVVYGHAWATGRTPSPPGEARVALDLVGRRER